MATIGLLISHQWWQLDDSPPTHGDNWTTHLSPMMTIELLTPPPIVTIGLFTPTHGDDWTTYLSPMTAIGLFTPHPWWQLGYSPLPPLTHTHSEDSTTHLPPLNAALPFSNLVNTLHLPLPFVDTSSHALHRLQRRLYRDVVAVFGVRVLQQFLRPQAKSHHHFNPFTPDQNVWNDRLAATVNSRYSGTAELL